jgi:hypothetical protein
VGSTPTLGTTFFHFLSNYQMKDIVKTFLFLNLIFFALGMYHFNTINIFKFDEIDSILNQHTDSNNSINFLLSCELVIFLVSFLLKKVSTMLYILLGFLLVMYFLGFLNPEQ